MVPNEDEKAKQAFVYLLTNIDDPSKAAGMYRKRWSIECCFKHLKSNGFDLEKTALEGTHKIEILFSILAFVYVLAIKEGVLNDYEEQVSLRTFANGKTYRKESLFIFGLAHLKPKIDNLKMLLKYLKNVMRQCVAYFINFNFTYT